MTGSAAQAQEPNLEHLKHRDFVLMFDRSGSMDEPDGRTGKSKWKNCQEACESVARRLEEYSEDGITVYDFNTQFRRQDHVKADAVHKVFEKRPDAGTRLREPLEDAFQNYLGRKKKGNTKANGELLIIVTDGKPEKPETVAEAIVRFTKKLDNGKEYAIVFLQVGNDPGAAEYLGALDDELDTNGAAYDIVSVLTNEHLGDIGLEAALISAITEAKIQ